MSLFQKFRDAFSFNNDILYISCPSQRASSEILYNWLGHVEGVTYAYAGSPAQKAINFLHISEPLYLAIFSSEPNKIAVLTQVYKQIGWFSGSHFELLRERLKNHEPIDAQVDDMGKIDDPNKDITWVSIRVRLYKNDNDVRIAKERSETNRIEQKKYREISKGFSGSPKEYIDAAKQVLSANDCQISSYSILKQFTTPGWIQWGKDLSTLILNIKTTGNLKYWLVPYPIEQIRPLVPENIACYDEHHYSTRVFIQSPSDLNSLSSLLCALHAPEKYNLHPYYDCT